MSDATTRSVLPPELAALQQQAADTVHQREQAQQAAAAAEGQLRRQLLLDALRQQLVVAAEVPAVLLDSAQLPEITAATDEAPVCFELPEHWPIAVQFRWLHDRSWSWEPYDAQADDPLADDPSPYWQVRHGDASYYTHTLGMALHRAQKTEAELNADDIPF